MLKINFKKIKKKYYFNAFQNEKTLKNNHYYNIKHYLKTTGQILLKRRMRVSKISTKF